VRKGLEPIAQLIKLQDYITRYEWDTYRYPTQYIRLKKENWGKLYELWENPVEEPEEKMEEEQTERESLFSRFKGKFTRPRVLSESLDEQLEQEENIPLPRTETALKQQFLDNLLNFQVKWATSTVTHSSFVNQRYYHDPKLKYLLQRFPDTFLMMYHPIFAIKKAPIEADIMLITPIEIEIVHFIEHENGATIMASDERFWNIESDDGQWKALNPIISLKRTEKIVKGILAAEQTEFTIRKTVLSRTNNIIFHTEPYNTRIIGRASYEDWFQEKRKLISPLKSTQIKAAEALLKHCQTTAVRRPEWEDDQGPLKAKDMED
jgi:hypothetical protein